MGCGGSKAADDGAKPSKDPLVVDASNSHPQNALSFFSLQHAGIKELNVSTCELRAPLPAAIGELKALTKLDLSQNKLESLPAELGKCISLTSLDCNDNQLKTLPAELGQLKRLERLLVYKNVISSIPEELGNLLKLVELNLFNNKVLKMPATLGKLTEASEVNFAANKVMQIPEDTVKGWESVTVLNLYDNRILKMASLGHMQKLEELRLFGNQLSAMPEFGTGLPGLRILELHKNQISVLPEDFFTRMPELKKLTLADNKLTALPNGIGGSGLEALLANGNQIVTLPDGVATMPALQVLFVQDNALTSIPPSFSTNTTLKRVNLSGNKIVGCGAELSYLKAQCTKLDGMFWPPSG